MKKLFVFVLLGGFVLPSASWAIDLKQAKFTQVVNSVDVISQSAQGRHAAAVNDVFTMPDVLRTGPDSRAELVAADNTITRVGANTVFSYDPASRTIDLQQGSLLFHSPHGKGGGTIHTGSATASVLGTTIIVTCTPNGGFKLLNLEGQAEIKFLNGLHQTLQPGQMTFALQGGGTSPVIVFRLDSQTKGSTLVSGFATPLPSAGKINAEVTRQLLQILNNNAQDTGLVVGNNATPDSVQVVQDINNQNPPPTSFDKSAQIVGHDHVSTLPVSYNPPTLPLNPAQIETPITVPDNIVNAVTLQTELALLDIGAPPVGFVGDNIDIDTGLGDLGTPIDLSAYASDDPNHPNFEIVAANDLRIWRSAKFTGMSGANDTIGLIAGGKMLIAQNSTLEADTGNFDLAADSFGVLDTSTGLEKMNPDAPLNPEYPNELLDVSVINNDENDGGVDIQSVSSLNIESGIYNAGNGDLKVIAGGNIYIDHGDLEASSSSTATGLQTGSVYVEGTGNVDLEYTTITAKGEVAIESRDGALSLGINQNDTITAGGQVTVDAPGYVTVYSAIINAGGDVDIYSTDNGANIENATIQTRGNVNITSTGTLYLGYYNGVWAAPQLITADNVTLQSDDSSIDIWTTSINASGNVNITSYGTLTLERLLNLGETPDTIAAVGNVSLTSKNGAVDIYDSSSIYAGYDNSTKRPSASGGSIYINAYNGNVMLSDDYVFAYSGDSTTAGNINIYASGNIDFNHSDVYQDKSVSVTANSGYVNIYDVYNHDNYGNGSDVNSSDTYLTHWTIKAGSDVDITGDRDVSIYTSTISANGKVDIESGGTLNIGTDPSFDVTISAGGNVKLAADGVLNINYTGITVGSGVDLEGQTIANGSVTYSTGGEADLSGDTVHIIGSSITGNNISISDSTVTANNGDVNIDNHGNATFYAGSYSDISGSTTISLNNINISASTITANGGDVNISSDGAQSIQLGSEPTVSDSSIAVGDISITDSSYIYASGDVNISGSSVSGASIISASDGGNIDIKDSHVYAGYDYNNSGTRNVNISGQTISAADGENEVISASGGSIHINALNNVNILDTHFDVGGGISISGSHITANSGNVEITSGGTLSISAGGTVNISGSDVFAGNIDISGSSIVANGGDVNIDNNGSISLASGFDSAGKILVDEGSSIAAIEGNVTIGKIGGVGGVDLENSTVTATAVPTSVDGKTGNVTVNAGAGITVNGSTVNADTGAGTIALNSTAGQTTIQNSSMQAFYIKVNSADGILLDGTSSHLAGSHQLDLTSGNAGQTDTTKVLNADLSGFAAINLAANTLDIEYTDLGSGIVNLKSRDGTVNVNNGVIQFRTNLIQDKWNNVMITSPGQVGSGVGSTPGVYSSPL